jgi:hypothetical protein
MMNVLLLPVYTTPSFQLFTNHKGIGQNDTFIPKINPNFGPPCQQNFDFFLRLQGLLCTLGSS